MLKANKSADRRRSACSLLTAAVFIERLFSESPNLITLSRYARYAYSLLTAVVLSERLSLEPPHIGKGVLHVLFNLIILFVLKKARTTPGENLTVLNSSDLEPVETYYC